MADTLTPEQILLMQAQEKFAKSNKPRIKSTEVLSTVVAFVNTGDTSTLLDARFSDKEQAFAKVIKSHSELVGKVWPLRTDDGLHLVNIAANPAE